MIEKEAMKEKNDYISLSNKQGELGVLEENYLNYLLKVEYERSIRHLYSFSLAMIRPDISFESPEDDIEFQLQFSRILRQTIRNTDIIGRNLDNYMIILHQVHTSNIKETCEKIRFKIENYLFIVNNKKYNITASAGIVSVPYHCNCNNIQKLIKMCDNLLKEAQFKGGNKFSYPV